MTRLETCKTRLENKQKTSHKIKDLELLYQELINYLPTYNEKKEFTNYFSQIKETTKV